MRYGHLEQVKIKLTALSPVFIGSGVSLTKKEYILNKAAGKIYVPDLGRLSGFLAERSLLPQFERYLIQPRNNDLYTFLEENKVSREDYGKFVMYELDAGEAAWQEKFRGILTFYKGSDGIPYIPGSSLKGAIRTAMAAKLLQKGNFERLLSDTERESEDFRNPQHYIRYPAKQAENQLFCKLDIKDPRNPDKIRPFDIVNDFMRGLQISDSKPIGFENLTVCGKYDRKPDGYTNLIPIYRECLAPGTVAEFTMTLDRTVMSGFGIDADFIRQAITDFADKQHTLFDESFIGLKDDAEQSTDQSGVIVLGGGSGYVSKTITYPLFRDRNRALKVVGKMMTKQFRIHKHELDADKFKVSPHMLKMTMYKGKYYKMGRCEVEFIS